MAGRKRADAPARDVALDPSERVHRIRVCLVGVCFLVAYGTVAGRLVQLQTDPDARFSEEDLTHIGFTTLHRPRGDILDREGRVLATDRTVYSLAVNPKRVTDPLTLVNWITARIDADRDDVYERVTRRGSENQSLKFVWIKRRLDDFEAPKMGDIDEAPDRDALILQEETVRYYPEGPVAAHVLGFANLEGQGAEGVELAYDTRLRSEAGRKVYRVDSKRRVLDFLTLEYEPPAGGEDVTLTIDASLQHTLEVELDRAVEKTSARGAMGLLMDPNSGAVLALAARPAFDPNQYFDYQGGELKNRTFVDVFEPGSAFKIVAASAAIELGLVTPRDMIDCEGGSFNPYGHRIQDTHPRGLIPFSQAFAESSNIATIKLGALLGQERLETWIRRFGFGTKTGLDLPGESNGLFRPRREWSRLSMGSLPIGQEIAVTMMQLAQGYNVIANGGYRVEPYLVEKATGSEGEITYLHRGRRERVLSEETAEIMRALCHHVVTWESGTGWRAAIPEYRVGGKTGTAQIARSDGRGYYTDRYTAVFAGFGPIIDPRLTCVVVVQEPKMGTHHGGQASGPVFKAVMLDALTQLHVPPDPMRPTEKGQLMVASASGLKQMIDADTVATRPSFDAVDPIETKAITNYATLQLTHGGELEDLWGPRLPDFSGMTKRQAKAEIVALGLQWDPQGVGRVVSQYPPAGAPLNDVAVCRLVFDTDAPEAANEAS